MQRIVSRLVPAIVLIGCATSCTSAPEPALTPEAYRAAVEAICTATTSARAETVEPSEAGAVAEFARTVARQLDDEANLIRNLRPPVDLDDDHRALVQNTADQADRWTALATISPADTESFGTLTDEIASLSFGRDDLAEQMDLSACRKTT